MELRTLHHHVDHVKVRESNEENQESNNNNSNWDYIDGSTNESASTVSVSANGITTKTQQTE